MARRAPAQKNANTGCGCAFVVLVVFVVLPAVAFGTYVALGPPSKTTIALPTRTTRTPAPPMPTTTTPTTPPTAPAATVQVQEPRPTLPVSSTRGSPASVWRLDDDPFRVGWCASSSTTERSRTRYERMSGGSAQWLRKKVVIVHLRVEAPGAVWSNDERMRLDLAADSITKLYEREAKRYGINDLVVRTVEWPLMSAIPVPVIAPGARDVMPAESVRALRRSVKAGLLGAEQRTLDGIADGYKQQGYSSVAFIIYIPTMSTARSFASPHDDSDASAEMAFVFESKTLVAMATAGAHEGLHLFGADDLYNLSPGDDADDHDLMSSCRGFNGNGISDATAWAIGWRASPPARRYRF